MHSSTPVSMYSCTHLLRTPLLITHVLMYSCTLYSVPCTPVPVYSVLMYSCTCTYVPVYSVLMYSCTIIVNLCHTDTVSMSMKIISVISLTLLSRQKSKENIKRTYRISSSSSSRYLLAASRSSTAPGLLISISSSVPGGQGVRTASSNRTSSSHPPVGAIAVSKAVATSALRSSCLGGAVGCLGGGDTLSVSGV